METTGQEVKRLEGAQAVVAVSSSSICAVGGNSVGDGLEVRYTQTMVDIAALYSTSPVTSAAASSPSFLRRLLTRLKLEMKAKKMVKLAVRV
nr:hypothetical protein Itr_chr12CG14720 [Ipomoea trifida]GMD63491.1 hypothetical protein Iba_chr12bCG15370 [Ipomoea batatas]